MVDYSKMFKPLRDIYVPQKLITVQLPPIKEDCTCMDGDLSFYNSPVDYCEDCDNKGYIETPVTVEIQGSVVDYHSEAQQFSTGLIMDGEGDFNYQRYVIHANQIDCTTAEYPGQLCFDISKEVVIDSIEYRILAIDKSTMLGQIRVLISKTN